jgi:hypothetical protein
MKQSVFDIVFPIGAGGNFLKYWIGVGLGYFEEKDPIPLESWNLYHPPGEIDHESIPSPHWCAEVNEYYVHDKRLLGRHPSRIMFVDPYFDKVDDSKRILVDCYDCIDYIFNLYKSKKTTNTMTGQAMTQVTEIQGSPIQMPQLKFEDKVKLDSKICRAVNKHLHQQDIPSIILDYNKFFIQQNKSHINDIANFVGFQSTEATTDLIKYYTERNKKVYESISLH